MRTSLVGTRDAVEQTLAVSRKKIVDFSLKAQYHETRISKKGFCYCLCLSGDSLGHQMNIGTWLVVSRGVSEHILRFRRKSQTEILITTQYRAKKSPVKLFVIVIVYLEGPMKI